jgi:hypothetical protein
MPHQQGEGCKGGGAESGTDIGNEPRGKSGRERKMEKEEVEGEMAMDLYSTLVGLRESSRVPSKAPYPKRQPPFPDADSPTTI